MNPDKALSWRQRLVQIRGIAMTALALLFLMLSRKLATGLPDLLVAALLGLLAAPSLLFFATRNLSPSWQARLLPADLFLDGLLFLLFLLWAGGASNPLSFYLLVPILLAALACRLWVGLTLWVATCLALLPPLTGSHTSLPGAAVHAMTHAVDPMHALGMWLIFLVLGLVLLVMGQGLQTERRQREAWQGTRLEVALQRERMYETAATQAHLAHEINTPLSSLLWIVEDLQREAHSPQQASQLDQLAACATRISTALRHGAENDVPSSPCNLKTMTDWLAKRMALLNPALVIQVAEQNEEIRLRDTDTWARILLNLAYNASDAGALCLSIECRMLPDNWIMQASDDGPGRVPAHDEHSGLGIGLALVETALSRFHGQLQRQANASWTVVTLTLPQREGLEDDG